jgi:hypothetical protein
MSFIRNTLHPEELDSWTRGEDPRRKTMPHKGGNQDRNDKSRQQSGGHMDDDKRRSSQQQAEGGASRQQGGHRGGSGNFAEDRERASEAGRKGGQR